MVNLEHSQRPLKILLNIYYYNYSLLCPGTKRKRRREMCILNWGLGDWEGGRAHSLSAGSG